MRRIAYVSALPLAVLLAACGDGTSPTGSEGTPAPVVAGDPFTVTLTTLADAGLPYTPVDMNNGGQMVGSCTDRDAVFGVGDFGDNPAFIFSVADGLRALGTLGGARSCAAAINDAGAVVGYSETGGNRIHTFVWTSGGGMHDLGTLPGGTQSRALDVNNAGQVVGWSNAPDGCKHAVVWDQSGAIHDLGRLPVGPVIDGEPQFGAGSHVATAINDLGQVTGYAQGRIGAHQSSQLLFIWTEEDGMERVPIDVFGTIEQSFDISDEGFIVGTSTPASASSRFVYVISPACRAQRPDRARAAVLREQHVHRSQRLGYRRRFLWHRAGLSLRADREGAGCRPAASAGIRPGSQRLLPTRERERTRLPCERFGADLRGDSGDARAVDDRAEHVSAGAALVRVGSGV